MKLLLSFNVLTLDGGKNKGSINQVGNFFLLFLWASDNSRNYHIPVRRVICVMKMHSKPNQKPFLFIILATRLSICFPGFFCQTIDHYATCIEPFQCGRLRNISYPFWGGIRPLYCGYPGFELNNCYGDNVPMLNISSLSYRVLEINFSTNTLKVARQDLWNSICPTNSVLHDTTLDPDLFEIPPGSNDRNVTLYYDCTNNQQNRLLNQFSCDVNGVTTMNVFSTGSGPGPDIKCSYNISVPVNQTAAQALETPTASSINVLQTALASGFFIKWSEICTCGPDPNPWACVYKPESGLTGCYWRKPDSVAPKEPPGMRPPQIPGAPGPESGGDRSYPAPPASAPSATELPLRSSGRARIIIGVVLGITSIVIFTIVLVCYLKRRSMPGNPNQVSNQLDVEKFLLQHGSLAPKRYKYSEIKEITKCFNDKLGQGGYGSVYKGILPDGSQVAIKVLTDISSNGEEFINEVASISRTAHVNVVNLLGFCYDGNKRALVYEFMPNKSLDKFISNSGSVNADCHLDLNKLYKIAVGVAKGLEYLHTGCTTRIVHFDIKPQNILLDEDFCPKISDFGLAKLCKKKQSVLSMLGTRGTVGYIAPEIFFRTFGQVSYKSDVYSYGMMVLEMVGAKKIIASESIQSSGNYFPDKIYDQVTLDVTRKLDDFMVEEEEETARKLFLVGFWCIQTAPSDRPSMSKIVEMLEGSLQSIQIPPKPILFTPTLPRQEFSPSMSAYAETENSAEV